MIGFKADIYGLDEIKETINSDKIMRRIEPIVGLAALGLHSAMRDSITRNFQYPKTLDSVLVGKTTSTAKFGQNVIENGIVYEHKPIDLSKFKYTYYLGNINAGATRQGQVHEVTVRRGSKKIVYGKEHRGGFVPRRGNGAVYRNGRYGAQMFERMSEKKKPLRLLLAPSLSTLASRAFDKDPQVQKEKDKMELLIIEKVIQ